MLRIQLKSKIHKATVIEANIDYVGSITIDEELMDYADLWEGEKVLVVDNTNGARLDTYVIKGERGSGVICMNGAAAHHVRPGDDIIVMAFAASQKRIRPKSILVDKRNRFVRYLEKETSRTVLESPTSRVA